MLHKITDKSKRAAFKLIKGCSTLIKIGFHRGNAEFDGIFRPVLCLKRNVNIITDVTL
jgi:hypothetical protein